MCQIALLIPQCALGQCLLVLLKGAKKAAETAKDIAREPLADRENPSPCLHMTGRIFAWSPSRTYGVLVGLRLRACPLGAFENCRYAFILMRVS
jgi:hypothetical protein